MDEDRGYLAESCQKWVCVLLFFFWKIEVVSMWLFTCPENKRESEVDEKAQFVATQLICVKKPTRMLLSYANLFEEVTHMSHAFFVHIKAVVIGELHYFTQSL